MATRYSTSADDFKKVLNESNHLVVLTGAGISAESGIPTFRGEGGLWKTYKATDLATPDAFKANPNLVWEFYQFRREVVMSKQPNPGHYALVKLQEKFEKSGKKFTLITQNIDGFHIDSGSKDVIEMHGNLFKTRCTKCNDIQMNRTPTIYDKTNNVLPKCEKCEGLIRPHVVWFNESLGPKIMEKITDELMSCDLFMIVGTSGTVYPAAGFGYTVSVRNVPIAEFNIDEKPGCSVSKFYFQGKSGELLPKLLE